MNRRIVILGFMGSGKTTVATELARQLECGLIDLDSFIAAREGRTPAEIVEADGENSFREIETIALRDVLQDKQVRVIALGGGTWTIPANRTLIALYDCLSVWLDAPFELCWGRICAEQTVRPLAPDRETALALYKSRRANYALAKCPISVTESDTVAGLVESILHLS